MSIFFRIFEDNFVLLRYISFSSEFGIKKFRTEFDLSIAISNRLCYNTII